MHGGRKPGWGDRLLPLGFGVGSGGNTGWRLEKPWNGGRG
ncbi:hypothetical protein A11S_1869 [Micavibrio aeruginosavorus EPB]|uniref:Uncharacterized protein n=1 Tax=Micavibrio aeruginosavorus EPB TaxID=349215 RepID=M4VKP8_9BACT|nr:hypothetical protein A11S_1869 [Micavibrio aeruginosavorus EPB]